MGKTMSGNRSPIGLLLAVCTIIGVTSTAYAGDTRSVMGTTAVPDATQQPPIASQMVMFYYDDLAAAEEFYGTILGLDKTQHFGWAKLFRVSAGAEVGIVKSGSGAYHAAQRNNAVMLSIVTTDVHAWYARLKAAKGVRFLAEISSGQSAPIRNFMIEDPGGYTVEFFQWL
jgi:hypothetical protein